jgi:hypothetical protein
MAVTTAQLIGSIFSLVALLFAIYVFARVLTSEKHWHTEIASDFKPENRIYSGCIGKPFVYPNLSKIKRQKREKRPNLLMVSKRVRYAHRRNKKG